MQKMTIMINKEKVDKEKKYNLNLIYETLENLFLNIELKKEKSDGSVFIYIGNNDGKDFARFGRVVNTLKKQSWFLENASEWILEEIDEITSDTITENLLTRYKK